MVRKYEAFLKSHKLFDGIDPYFATKIADGLNFKECKTGDTILTQGEANDTFYFVEKGNVKVSKDGKDIFMLSAGDYFGEVSLLNSTTACCTVKCSVRNIPRITNPYRATRFS